MMSKKEKSLNKKAGIKIFVYLWALLPVASAVLSYLLYAIDTRAGIFIRPIFEFSVVGVICVLGMIFLTGLAGYGFAKAKVRAVWAVLIGNAIPILCTLAFLVLTIAGQGESDASMMCCFFAGGVILDGVGLVTGISGAHGDFEIYVTLALIIAIFVVGYSLGAVGKITKKK